MACPNFPLGRQLVRQDTPPATVKGPASAGGERAR